MMQAFDALRGAAAALDRASQCKATETVEADAVLPLIIKNTFFDLAEARTVQDGPKSRSCPAEVFTGRHNSLEDGFVDLSLEDFTAAARLFSTTKVDRSVMESSGHIAPTSRAVVKTKSTADVTCGTEQSPSGRRKPPPALEVEFPEPEEPAAPAWTPKMRTPLQGGPCPPPMWEAALEDTKVPEAPAWTPKVEGVGPLEPSLQQSPNLSIKDVPGMPEAPAWIPSLSSPAPPQQQAAMNIPGAMQVCSLQAPDDKSLWRVTHGCGISLRSGPGLDTPLTGHNLEYNEIFEVAEEIAWSDGRMYLRLADGRGWAFDNSVLVPHSPSVVRGTWVRIDTSMQHAMPVHMSPSPDGPSGEQITKKSRRRKRGGVRRNKNKNKNKITAPGFSSDSGAGAETEIPSDVGLQEKEEDSEEDGFK